MMRASREFIVDSCHPTLISCQGPVSPDTDIFSGSKCRHAGQAEWELGADYSYRILMGCHGG